MRSKIGTEFSDEKVIQKCPVFNMSAFENPPNMYSIFDENVDSGFIRRGKKSKREEEDKIFKNKSNKRESELFNMQQNKKSFSELFNDEFEFQIENVRELSVLINESTSYDERENYKQERHEAALNMFTLMRLKEQANFMPPENREGFYENVLTNFGII